MTIKPVTLYWAEWPGDMGVPAALTSEDAGIVAGDDVPAGSEPSDVRASIGMRSDGGLPANWSFKDIMIYDVALQPADILNVIQTSVWTPSTVATTQNVTSYQKGINGIMVDLADLPPGTVLSAADFQFKTGTSNDPGSWTDAPAPTAVVVRPGAGENGSDRVEITWANNAIQNTWLQVTVLGNDPLGGYHTNIGLARSEVFYFGNRIGDTFQLGSPAAAVTNATDEIQARANGAAFVGVENIYDFNRDRLVNATDQIIARSNGGILPLLDIPRQTVPPAPLAVMVAAEGDSSVSAVASALALAATPTQSPQAVLAVEHTRHEGRPRAASDGRVAARHTAILALTGEESGDSVLPDDAGHTSLLDELSAMLAKKLSRKLVHSSGSGGPR